MKDKHDRVIDLQKVKDSRRQKKRRLVAVVVVAAVILLLAIGWIVFSQILEVVGPGDFWVNFSS